MRNFILSLICTIFGHRRSKRHARNDGEQWRSICARCEIPLARIGPKTWREIKEDHAA